MRPRLLDLFCGAGGAAMGYHRAGFEVVGVDINPQPRYPFEFHQCDALHALACLIEGDGPAWVRTLPFHAIHASPPCQLYSQGTRGVDREKYPDLVGGTRRLLRSQVRPYVIENVPGAPLLGPLTLCGTEFNLIATDVDGRPLELRRHRLFESNIFLHGAGGCQHRPVTGVLVAGAYRGGRHRPEPSRRRTGNPAAGYVPTLAVRRSLLGIDWETGSHETNQAIPPAYTEFIGRQLLDAMGADA